ncbi:cytochrome c1 heme lyase [Scheffersomyces amazonensis]|uniref:cytochrome c1 heme lyase n=1 Tax=Scheffersomyces amazonensis TaxID=1078765 RepID=UPI00315D6F56
MSKEEVSGCPVDHTTREAWIQRSSGKNIPVDHPKIENIVEGEQAKCPVDHSAREAWVSKVSVSASASNIPEAIEVDKSCSSDKLINTFEDTTTTNINLPTERDISSIPRTSSNSNWIYPSQKQFYEAMKRKNWNPTADDMKTVVPIHNAVNERAWYHILQWEQPLNEKTVKECGGVTLTSFKGDSKKLTPRAWFNSTFLGYEKPFDRHDWTISRCGTDVQYVIDFYGGAGQGTGVFLDVRPKINTWEGFKLRIFRALNWN